MVDKRIQTGILICLAFLCASVQSFSTLHSLQLQRRHPQQSHPTSLFLVTEDDVIKAVEEAEELWAKALEARKTANTLSDRAEEEAEASSARAKEVEAKIKDNNISKTPITMETLAEGDAVARSSLDAGNLVNRALAASAEADQLLQLAEEALEKSETTLEQHLIDFPDSALAE
eukprot:CAMPEP_0113628258 /NCGR_PEP_ID=MMETSP0017_2-20120614/14640_1 /TAXON_ID=2856 /ORGANISM="Cylindrotheca closterium" /LENGTH=173 /DNA_ID=CAMNT_0000538553 /DNA_START=1 /DNA_END=522 /DNA_ORIENTATION=- /assembly_acc=CAM_ASM_000147